MKNIDYSKIISRSWYVTWKNKWLWVLGLVLAMFGAGGGGGGGGGSSSGSSTNFSDSPSGSPLPNDLKEKTSYVLGTATNYLQDWFLNVPVQNWIVLGLIVLLLAIFATVVVWVVTNWAKGALIMGFEDANNDKQVTLKSVSPYGLKNVKKLIIFGLLSTSISLSVIFCIALVIGISYLIYLVFQTLGIVLLVLMGVLGVLLFIFMVMIFTMVSIYAERLIVIKNMEPWNAWKQAFKLSKGNFFPTLVMGIINTVIGTTVGCLGIVVLLIVFSIPGFILIYPIFKNGFVIPTVPQIIMIIIFFMLFFSINLMIKSIFVVFNYGNWNLFFKQIIDNENIKNE